MNEGKIVISPSKKVREGWAEIIKMEMDKNGQPNAVILDFIDDEHDKKNNKKVLTFIVNKRCHDE